NRNRHIQRSRCLPHFVESLVINLNERTGSYVFAQIKTKRFEHFYSPCTGFLRDFDLFRLKARVIRQRDLSPPRLRKHDESIRMRFLPVTYSLFEQRTVSAS